MRTKQKMSNSGSRKETMLMDTTNQYICDEICACSAMPSKLGAALTSLDYNGGLTAEQFLFYEMRIVSKMYTQGKPLEEILETVKRDNLFQYPTERQVSRLTRACYKHGLHAGRAHLCR